MLARALDAWWDELGRPDAVRRRRRRGRARARWPAPVLAARPAVAPCRRRPPLRRRRSRRRRGGQRAAHAGAGRVRLRRGAARRAAHAVSSSPTSCSTTCPSASRSATAAGGRRFVDVDAGGASVEVLRARSPRSRPCLPATARARGPGARSRTRPRRWVARRARPPPRAGGSWSSTTPSTTAEMAARPWREWLRTYRGHERGGHYLRRPRARRTSPATSPSTSSPRAEPTTCAPRPTSCAAHGLDELVEEGRRTWAERAGGARPGRADGPQPGPGGRGAHRPGRPRWLHGRRMADRLIRPSVRAATAECTDRGHERSWGVGASSGRPSRTPGGPTWPTSRRGHRRPAAREPHLPAAAGLQGGVARRRHLPLRRGRRRLPGLLGPAGGRRCSTGRRSGTPSASGTCPFAKWFVGGKLNVADNCLDRHVEAGRGDKVAFHWEGEPGDTRTITYAELLAEVQRFANVLKALGVERGRPGQHLPADDPRGCRSPCWPAPASAPPHCVVFGGFSSDGARRPHQRRARPRCSSPPTAATGGARSFPLKPNADVAVESTPSIEHVVVVRRGGTDGATWRRAATTGTTSSWPTPTPSARPSRWTASSCSTCSTRRAPPASPRASCTPPAATSRRSPSPTSTCSTSTPTTDVYWCTADIGWVTGHSYIVYGPLANGATSVIYEGMPEHPGQRPLVGDRREVQGHDPLHGAHRHPDLHEVGRRASRPSTTCRRCACSARSASPSTPRRGCGTGSTSAAAAARSSTPGGRPRPAAS